MKEVEDIVISNEWKDFKERLKTNPPEYCKKYVDIRKITHIGI